jgi:hypothetical protein
MHEALRFLTPIGTPRAVGTARPRAASSAARFNPQARWTKRGIEQVYLPHMAWVASEKYVKVKTGNHHMTATMFTGHKGMPNIL